MKRRATLAGALACLLAGCLLAGCLMDPSVYRGTGGPAPRGQRAAQRGGRREGPGDRDDVRVAPARLADQPGEGDIRVFPAKPTPLSSPNNVAIIVEKLGLDQDTLTEANLAFRAARGDVDIRGGHVAQRNGLRVAVTGPDFHAKLQARHRARRSSTREQMFITCLSGTEGQIQVGEDTFVQSLSYWTPSGTHVLIQRAFVGRALAVKPVILPGRRVQVTVWPRFTARTQRGHLKAIDVTQLATTVVVRDGQSIVLGGMTTGGDDVGSVLFGIGRTRRSGQMTLLLTPKIGGLPFEWPKGLP